MVYYANAGFLDDAGAQLKGAEETMKQFAPVGAIVGAGLLLAGHMAKGSTGGALLLAGIGLTAVGAYYIFGNAANPLNKANYAYPEFYPYPSPGYFQYLTDPRMSQNFSHGVISVPRISNALAASTAFDDNPAVDKPTYTHRSPEKDLNHVHALDTPPGPDKTDVINYEPDHKRGACNPQRDSNHIISIIGTY